MYPLPTWRRPSAIRLYDDVAVPSRAGRLDRNNWLPVILDTEKLGFDMDTTSMPAFAVSPQHNRHVDDRMKRRYNYGAILQVRELSSYTLECGRLRLQYLRLPGDALVFSWEVGTGEVVLEQDNDGDLRMRPRTAEDKSGVSKHGACGVGWPRLGAELHYVSSQPVGSNHHLEARRASNPPTRTRCTAPPRPS